LLRLNGVSAIPISADSVTVALKQHTQIGMKNVEWGTPLEDEPPLTGEGKTRQRKKKTQNRIEVSGSLRHRGFSTTPVNPR